MAFLDRLSKGVSKAAGQAKFEADKLMRVNKLSSEASELARQVEQTAAAIGHKALELVTAGEIEAPVLLEMAANLTALETDLAAKRAEMEDAKVAKFEEGAVESVVTPVEAENPMHCANCGAELQAGAKFCPSCGSKTGEA